MIRFFVRIITRFILSLRYRIEVKGLDSLTTKEGICFFPSHPSLLDPVILMTLLGKEFKPRPVVVETVYEMPFIHGLMKLMKAIAIPDFDLGGNDYTKLLAKRALADIQHNLSLGENILLYPAGRLKRGPYEELKGTSGAFDIVKGSRKTTIVLVRTEGLWGSLFSLARTESSAHILKALLKSSVILLKNLIVFAPRRKVTITFYEASSLLYTYKTKEGFNKALEEWYNRPYGKEGEPLKLVREAFWSSKLPMPLERKQRPEKEALDLPEEITKKVIHEIAYIAKRKVEDISINDALAGDVGLDSLDLITLIAYLEDEFGLRHIAPQDLETVFDAVYVVAHKADHKKNSEASTKGWGSLEHRHRPGFSEGHTIIEVFLRNCDKRQAEPASADLLSGQIFTYERAKQIVVILSRRFQKIPEKKVGVMMPATSMAYFVVLGLMLAGKTPVMLNWTLGHFLLSEAMKSADVQHIITSQKFVRFAKTMDLEGIDDKLLFLEDLNISRLDKLRGWLASQKNAEALLKKAPPLTGESHAVILFTSGSENVPKSVPLTHKNILSNQRSAFSVVHFHKDDVLLGFLPPFHSFGFGVTGLLPFLSGLLVLFSPDPTDSFRLAESLNPWRITFLCGAPTFLRALFNACEKGMGKTVRLIVTGAEKAPQSLLNEAKRQCENSEVLEGYGITECSPILTLNRPGEPSSGVGKPLPGVELAICDLEQTKLLPLHEEGIVLARGPNIFNGYLSKTAARPFVTLSGKKWYVTGDLGVLDESGALLLSGRLKRFVKIGGEMINLLFLEEILIEGLGASDNPYLAVIALEKENARPELILFTTKNVSLDEANRVLRNKKIGHLAKLSRIVPIEEMPLLGTGKVNIRALEALVKK